jgi:SWI/SNF-related matrix-associated actin-dependent regulator 1 of chromatin subfamily A
MDDYISVQLTPEERRELLPMLMGYVLHRNSQLVRIEDNVVNRIVLGRDPLEGMRAPEIKNLDWYDTRLAEYQLKDGIKAIQLGNCLNRNRMGFGKTVETIVTLKAWDARDTVIVAPKPVCNQWKEHYKEWWPEMYEDVGVFDLKKPTVILNYEKLLQTATLSKLRSRRHDCVVFDEVHYIKNKDSQRTIASKQIPAACHLGLTGTPILKQPDDLWSILNGLDWRYSGKSYWTFVNYFCNVVDGYFGRSIEGLTKNTAHIAILHKLLDLVSLYNGEIEVAHGKHRTEIWLDMSPKQATLYKKIKKLVLDELPENCTIANGAVLALRLQQTTSWPGLFEVMEGGAKFEWVRNFCESTDEQVAVFTKFEKTAAALQVYLRKHKITSTTYTGALTAQVREQNKQRFVAGAVQVIIGTIGAMGTGVDGLQKARLGIMMERDWSPEINEQCEDRLHRRGQDNPVMWYYLGCNKSFDKRVGKINLSKADSIRAALEVDE